MSTLERNAGTIAERYGGQQIVKPKPPTIADRYKNGLTPPEEEEDAGLLGSLGAGFLRGLIEPATIIDPVQRLSERLSAYSGTGLGSKAGYGIGFLAGLVIPVAAEYKVADKLVRGLGGARMLVSADKAADLTRVGKFTRGAVAGAMFGAGHDAEDPRQWIGNVGLNAGLGGTGDVVLPAAWAAIAARFGKKVNPAIEATLRAGVEPEEVVAPVVDAVVDAVPAPPKPGEVVRARVAAKQTEAGVRAHARAMQLLDEMDMGQPSQAVSLGTDASGMEFPITGTKDAWPGLVKKTIRDKPVAELETFGTAEGPRNVDVSQLSTRELDPAAYQGTASRRLALRYGLQELNLPTLQPGEMRIIPTPHGDSGELSSILQRLPEIEHLVPVRPDDPQIIVAAKGTKGLTQASADIAKWGFARGQSANYNGNHWIAVRPNKEGTKVYLTQPGRLSKPLLVDADRVAFLPRVMDVSTKSARKISPMADDFVLKYSLFPDKGMSAALSEYFASIGSELPVEGLEKPLRGLVNASERLDLEDVLTKMQQKALADEDEFLGQTIETLDKTFERLAGKLHPDGPVDELAAQKGLTYVQELIDKKWHYIFKDASARPVSAALGSKDKALSWLRSYGVQADEIVKDLPILDGTVPGAGVSSMPTHTALEVSNAGGVFTSGIGLNLFAEIMPRAQFFKFIEDRMIKLGMPFKPYTEIFVPWMLKKQAYQREYNVALKGGKLADGTPITGLLQIFNPHKPPVREAMKENVTDLMHKPFKEWDAFVKESGLNDKERQVATELRGWYKSFAERLIKDLNVNITADDLIENYFPHYLKKSDAGAEVSIKAALGKDKYNATKPMIDFLSDMQRKGTMTKWDKDPFTVSLKYMRGALYKSHLNTQVDDVVSKVNGLSHFNPDGSLNKDLLQLKRSMVNYTRLTAFGQPEAFHALDIAFENTLKTLKLNIDEGTKDRLLNTYLALNWGAFLGFRIGPVVRNFTQLFTTGYTTLGAKYMTYGLTMAAKGGKEALEELASTGVKSAEFVPIPGEELIFSEIQSGRMAARGKLSQARQAAVKFSQLGMKGYNTVDEITRASVYWGSKRKIIDASNAAKASGWDETKFLRKSGLNFLGESGKQEFLRRQAAHGTEEAAKWASAVLSWDTNWIYKLGAGPALFSSSLGRIAGQYGTWPSWYGAFLAQGAKNLKGVERAVFLARNVAVHKGMIAAGAAAGYNLGRWTGLSSFSWTGGPVVDWGSDIRDIVGGITNSGDSTVGRDVALGARGLEDDGEGFSMLPNRLGGRIRFKEPTVEHPNPVADFIVSMLSAVTPGYLGYKDARRVLSPEESDKVGALLGVKPTTGHEFPEMR